jgi:hypothetical protein
VGDHAGILGAVVFFQLHTYFERDIVDTEFHASVKTGPVGHICHNLPCIRKEKGTSVPWMRVILHIELVATMCCIRKEKGTSPPSGLVYLGCGLYFTLSWWPKCGVLLCQHPAGRAYNFGLLHAERVERCSSLRK